MLVLASKTLELLKKSALENQPFCANENCAKGWKPILLKRTFFVFNRVRVCSKECMQEHLFKIIHSEVDQYKNTQIKKNYRLPIGLALLEHGLITHEQLRRAVEQQQAAGTGRLGYWLIQQNAIHESQIAQILGAQWCSPVLSAEACKVQDLSVFLPRYFMDAYKVVPLRLISNKMLYLGYEDRPDPMVTFAVEQVSGLKVESGFVNGTEFSQTHKKALQAQFPSVELIEASSMSALIQTLVSRMEKTKPANSRLVRIHDCLWLRMWRHTEQSAMLKVDAMQDLICSVRTL